MGVLRDLLLELGASNPKKTMQWKFALMANGLLLILTPMRSRSSAKRLADHFFPLLLHQQASQRCLAGFFFIYILNDGPAWMTVSQRFLCIDDPSLA